jgi:hypothetical protein
MEETKMWANLNDSYNQEIIIIENNNLKNYIPKIEKKQIIAVKTVETIEDTKTIIDNILSLPYNNLNIYEIIKNQLLISNYLVKLYKSCNDNIIWEHYSDYLKYIHASSMFIIKKKNIDIKVFKTDMIYRSSYKFCNKVDMCDNLYSNKLKSSCNCDHYVHHKLVSDLECLIYVFENNIDLNKINLRRGLETSNFVLNHMFQELNSIKLYYENEKNFNIENYYIINHRIKKN